MALNPEPADPTERRENELPPKSYAAAAVEPIPESFGESLAAIDEESIKETPPRPNHPRTSSEPRPFGEIIDEGFEEPSSPTSSIRTSSPTLRHPKGRLEEKSSWENAPYAAAVKDGVPDSIDDHTNGVNGHKDEEATNGTKTPEVLEGAGQDEAPRSPIRRAHKRLSSRELNGTANKQQKSNDESPTSLPNSVLERSEPVKGANGDTSNLVYENLTNKSGENLASLKPSEGYYLSLAQRENKDSNDASYDRPPKQKRRDSELVSGRRAGAGWHRSPLIRWAPFNVPLQRRLQTLLVLLHTLSIAGLLAVFFLLCTIPLLWPILLPYLIYVLLSRAGISGELGHRSERFRHSKIWSLFGSYFPARLHRSEPLEPTRKYIFGYHPHGIISHGAFAAFATEALGFSQLFPGITNTLLTLDSNFRIPLYREYALRMGLASVSRESCENLLSKGGRNGEGMGRAITIVVGGARESLDAKPYTLRLVLKKRKGFVKLAIRCGADLVPTLAFGENDIYDQLDTNRHPYIHRLQMAVKKFMGFTVPLFHARGIFNYDVGLMPYRRPINVVVGRPVKVMQRKNPEAAYVDEIHELYVEELMRIWEEWKDVFARGRKGEVEIVE